MKTAILTSLAIFAVTCQHAGVFGDETGLTWNSKPTTTITAQTSSESQRSRASGTAVRARLQKLASSLRSADKFVDVTRDDGILCLTTVSRLHFDEGDAIKEAKKLLAGALFAVASADLDAQSNHANHSELTRLLTDETVTRHECSIWVTKPYGQMVRFAIEVKLPDSTTKRWANEIEQKDEARRRWLVFAIAATAIQCLIGILFTRLLDHLTRGYRRRAVILSCLGVVLILVAITWVTVVTL